MTTLRKNMNACIHVVFYKCIIKHQTVSNIHCGIVVCMTQEEVLAVLGQPRWKRHLVTTEWWLYKENSLYGTALVGFSAEEGLMSWKEP